MTKQFVVDAPSVRQRSAIRRWFMRRYHPDGAVVADLSKDGDLVWDSVDHDGIRRLVPPQVSGKRRQAREWLSVEEWNADVIDLGAGGEPWGAWEAILENLSGQAVTVFMSFRSAPLFAASKPVRLEAAKLLGIPESWDLWKAPHLSDLSIALELSRPLDFDLDVVDARRNGGPLPRETVHMGVRLKWKT